MNSSSKIICVGRNYAEHARELGNEVPTTPIIFMKPWSSVIRDGEAIRMPGISSRVEFEGEIGVVIGKKLRHANEVEAEAAVGAIVAVNDVTARDLQRSDGQWTRAKSFDTFCPIGTPSESFGTVRSLELVTRVNGEERQRASTTEMVFSIPFLLSFISQVMTLNEGDLILTGTPAGVGPLKVGDVVEVEVVGVSRVSNPVAEEG